MNDYVVRHTVRFSIVGRANRKKPMKILIMIWVSVVTSICIGFMVSDFIGSDYDKKQNARLNKLEAASTTAQQPQERHYFDTVENSPDTMLLKRGCSYTIKGDYQRGIVIICK